MAAEAIVRTYIWCSQLTQARAWPNVTTLREIAAAPIK